MLTEVRCELCGCNHQEVVYRTGRGDYDNMAQQSYLITEQNPITPSRIVKCAKCGLIFALPKESEQNRLLSFYIEMVDDRYVEEEVGRMATARHTIKKLNRFRKYGSRLLDVGCCTGFLLDEAKKAGWEVYGVEPSKWAADYAKEKFHLDIYNTTLEKAKFDSKYFDVVIMQDTIEHLLNPKEVLIEIGRILKPTGILYINTPDIESLASHILKIRWWGINQFTFYYFSKDTLNKLLESVGFKSISWSLYTRTFSLKYLTQRFKNYNRPIYRLLMFLFDVGRCAKLESRLFRINLGDEIEVFACKKE